MEEIDLDKDVPAAANAIEIQVAVIPRAACVMVWRGADDTAPLEMCDGDSTIIGVPSDRRLLLELVAPATRATLTVLRWLE